MAGFRISRRGLLAGAVPAVMGGVAAAQQDGHGDPNGDNYLMECDAQGACIMTETQQGDPLLSPEQVSISAGTVAEVNSPLNRGTLAPRVADFRAKFHETASTFVGFNREDNKADITAICNTLKVGFTYKTNGVEKYTAYCAAGLSYVAALTYAKALGVDLSTQKQTKLQSVMPEIAEYHFYPTVSCVNMFHVALGTRRWIEPSRVKADTLKQGMLILFDWKKSGSFYRADHCGIVDGYDEATKTVSTIEFNTAPEGVAGSQSDGGYVAKRRRSMSLIKGFIDPDVKNPFSIFQ